MSSTKIINVLKDDSFDEILDLFKATPAEEVIFVLPKRSRAFQKEDHFIELRSEAKDLGKSVSFLCSNPELNDLAKKYRFDVLLARSIGSGQARALAPARKQGSVNVVNQIEDFYSEPADNEEESISIGAHSVPEEAEEDPVTATSRRLDDIFVPESNDERSVKISGKPEKARVVEVSHVNSNSSSSTRSSRPNYRISLAILAVASIAVLGSVIYITTGKAQVTIKPIGKPLDVSINVIASDNKSSVDVINMAIPGQVFNIQKTTSQDFPATGHVDVAQKARGALTVYSELSSAQPLIATTRFESADHHIFHTLTSITVPPAKTINSKLTPGSIEVQVIADKSGADFNVSEGSFTIPAFKEKGDLDKYKKVYGKSSSAMRSGTSGQATVVTESDLVSAKQTLTSQLTATIQEELKSHIDGLKVLNQNEINLGQPTSTSPADPTSPIFTANLSGSLKTVGFKESDLDSLIVQYIESHDKLTVIPNKLNLTYDNIYWNEAKSGLSFSVHISGLGYTKIDRQRVISDLLGKNDSQIKAYLGGISGISEAHVSLTPFWVRSIPKNEDKVTVDLSY